MTVKTRVERLERERKCDRALASARVVIYRRGQWPPVAEDDTAVILLPDNGREDREGTADDK